MAELNNTFTDFGIQQGTKYLSFNKQKVSTIDGGAIQSSFSGTPQGRLSRWGTCGPVESASKIENFTGDLSRYGNCALNVNTTVEGFTGDLSRYGNCPLNVNTTVEGFTGAFGSSAANDRNNTQAQHVTQVRDDFDKARSQYANAQKTLMSETSMFVNNSSDSGQGSQYRNKFVKMKNGAMAFITDRNVIMPVDEIVYEANKGKNGCNPTVVQVPFGPEEGAPPGILRKAGTDPNFFIGQPLKMGQSCAATNVNVQVLGATDPDANTSSWLGCRKEWNGLEQQDISGMQQNAAQALERCRIRAADEGSAAYAIGASNYGGDYGCYIAEKGVTAEDIIAKTQLGTIQKVSNTLQSESGGGLSAGVFLNGQVGMASEFRPMHGGVMLDPAGANIKLWDKTPAFEDCDPALGAVINVTGATYGANCNGQTNPVAAAAAQADANAVAFKSYQEQQAKQAAQQKIASVVKTVV